MAPTLIFFPNEDGLGTSAWTVRIIKELLRAEAPAPQICVAVVSEALRAFHEDKYGETAVAVVRLPEVRHPIRLVKQDGGVNVPATLKKAVLAYPTSRSEYRSAFEAGNLDFDRAVIVDLGVPQAPGLLRELSCAGVRRAGPMLTLHDHAWSCTLEAMAEENDLLTPEVAAALEAMRADEASTTRTVLLPDPIAPPSFETYWREKLGVPTHRLPGVLGGPGCTRQWIGGEPRSSVRALLGIRDDRPVLFVSGGGTPVWDSVLEDLLNEWEADPPRYHVVVYNPAEAKRRGIVFPAPGGGEPVSLARHPRRPELLFLGAVEGETHHVLFAGFDLVLTRAGGGTVNDAVAFRVPLVLVEEQRHWQVEQIRRACAALGVCRAVTLAEFRRAGRRLVEDPRGELLRMEAARAAMERIPNHAERHVAQMLRRASEGAPALAESARHPGGGRGKIQNGVREDP